MQNKQDLRQTMTSFSIIWHWELNSELSEMIGLCNLHVSTHDAGRRVCWFSRRLGRMTQTDPGELVVAKVSGTENAKTKGQSVRVAVPFSSHFKTCGGGQGPHENTASILTDQFTENTYHQGRLERNTVDDTCDNCSRFH